MKYLVVLGITPITSFVEITTDMEMHSFKGYFIAMTVW
jgi:hypothetical protein